MKESENDLYQENSGVCPSDIGSVVTALHKEKNTPKLSKIKSVIIGLFFMVAAGALLLSCLTVTEKADKMLLRAAAATGAFGSLFLTGKVNAVTEAVKIPKWLQYLLGGALVSAEIVFTVLYFI